MIFISKSLPKNSTYRFVVQKYLATRKLRNHLGARAIFLTALQTIRLKVLASIYTQNLPSVKKETKSESKDKKEGKKEYVLVWFIFAVTFSLIYIIRV